MIMLIPI